MWSPEPVHEPLIPKWMFDEINARRLVRQGSRDGNAANKHPGTRHSYVLRGMVFCPCGRRMFGNARHHTTYYMCWPQAFYADRVFGHQRRELFEAALASTDDWVSREREAERERIQRGLADLARRQDNLLRQAQDCDPGDPFAGAPPEL